VNVVCPHTDERALAEAPVPVHRLVRRAPERRADRYSREFPGPILRRIFTRGAGDFFSESRIEDAAEVHVPGVAARRDDHCLIRVHRHFLRGGVNVPVREEALQRFFRRRIDFRRIGRADTDHAALLIPEELIHVVIEDEFHALRAGGLLKTSHQVRAAGTRGAFSRLPFSPDAVMLTLRAEADRVAAHIVRCLVDKLHAVLQQKFKGRSLVIGERVLHRAVVIAVVRLTAALHDAPVRQILEERFRIILDSVLLLEGGAAAKRHIAARRNRVAADIVVRIDHEDGKTRVTGSDRGRESGRAGTDHDDIRGVVPLLGKLLGFRSEGRGDSAKQRAADAASQKFTTICHSSLSYSTKTVKEK